MEVCSNKIKSKMPSKLARQVAFHIGIHNPPTSFLTTLQTDILKQNALITITSLLINL